MPNTQFAERCAAFKMKRTIQIVSILLVFCSCAPEATLFKVDDSKIGVNYKSSRGTIFNENYPHLMFYVSGLDSTNQWTPDSEDIELAEEILKAQIKEFNKRRTNQIGNCPIIHRNLYSYFRQYVGVINEEGQRVIHINFYWDKYGLMDRITGFADRRLDYDSDYTAVLDGCSYYWQINVNLDEKKLSDLEVNGVA